MEAAGLYVSIPLACFRVPRAREYFEAFPCPPPATVFGMLLSMVGEINRRVHEGAELAIAVLSNPAYSVVLRTLWRVKNKNQGPGMGVNRRPDFQELLTGIDLVVWIRAGSLERAAVPLVQRVRLALQDPSSIARFGGLSLGERTVVLVDQILVPFKFPPPNQKPKKRENGSLGGAGGRGPWGSLPHRVGPPCCRGGAGRWGDVGRS